MSDSRRYAQVEDGLVTNVLAWDGKGDLDLPGELVDVTDQPEVTIGSTRDGDRWTPPVVGSASVDGVPVRVAPEALTAFLEALSDPKATAAAQRQALRAFAESLQAGQE